MLEFNHLWVCAIQWKALAQAFYDNSPSKACRTSRRLPGKPGTDMLRQRCWEQAGRDRQRAEPQSGWSRPQGLPGLPLSGWDAGGGLTGDERTAREWQPWKMEHSGNKLNTYVLDNLFFLKTPPCAGS